MIDREMNDDEIFVVLRQYEASTVSEQSGFLDRQAYLLERYNREKYGNETPQRSGILSTDCFDIVEDDMPDLARVFLGAKKPCSINPRSKDDKNERDEALQKSEYVDYIIRKQRGAYKVNFDFLKSCEIYQIAALHYFIDEKKYIKRESFSGLNEQEIQIKIDQIKELKGIDEVEITQSDETEGDEGGVYEVELKYEFLERRARVINVPIEDLRITSNVSCIEDCDIVGHEYTISRGELLAQGYDFDLVDNLTRSSRNTENDHSIKEIRYDDQGGIHEEDYYHWANQRVDLMNAYVKIDKDGDGYPELRHMIYQSSSKTILHDEQAERVQYVTAGAYPKANSMTSSSRVEVVEETAAAKTAAMRGMMDNLYQHNNPQLAANSKVNKDDLINRRPGGIIRVKSDDPVGNNIFPVNIPFVGAQVIQVMQQLDFNKAQRTGSQMSTTGLTADTFNNETATRFEGIQDAGNAKKELIARNIAELAYKELYDGILWLVSNHQTTAVEIEILGQPLTVSPDKWKYDSIVMSSVGLGAGDGAKNVENMSLIINFIKDLITQGAPLSDYEKLYNAIDDMMVSMDIPNVSRYFNDPTKPQELLAAQNQQLMAQVQQLTMQVQQLASQDQLSKAELIRAQAKLSEVETKGQIEMAKAQENARQFNIKAAQEQEKINQSRREHEDDVDLRITDMELNNNTNLPGGLNE